MSASPNPTDTPQGCGVLVALATYNEFENISSLAEAIREQLPAADILIVDDNSPDGTGELCDKLAEQYDQLHVMHRPSKLGLGTAFLEAIRFAITHKARVLITLDADWSHDPASLPAFLAATERADVAVGSRYCRGGEIEGWPLYRRVISGVLNRTTRLLLRVPVSDASGSYRAYRVEQLEAVPLDQIRASGYSFLEEILVLLNRQGATFEEVPITFRQRREGHSKASIEEAVGKFRTIARFCFRGTKGTKSSEN